MTLVAGNWKMHGLRADVATLDAVIADRAARAGGAAALICPPATLVAAFAARAAGSRVAIGGQDCHAAASGAHTGDVSAAMLADAGATHVILGHSERRTDHGETDAQVAAKLGAAQAAGLVAVVCLGESGAERAAGQTRAVLDRQFAGLPAQTDPARLVLAYEPVWAIGTGLIPSLDQIAEAHGQLRAALVARFGTAGAGVPVLYGGSVKPENAAAIFAVAEVGGALVGGAALTPATFLPILAAAD